ncbi:CBS domain-containing protein [Pseudoponticoccus marisrubri]|uniref:CBS domain-containing protein n=1 Tax=Pseudoponticoccus marisrubri TaxID=1685382 RepID=A0A0W7WKJ6_9RHOB|nr:CBS domain-containing protein [Pseudoponticoccus marisrubri]KUF11133.1 hypothetical protein AVJ23_08745 [Pseudoponticoccus marisrubri]
MSAIPIQSIMRRDVPFVMPGDPIRRAVAQLVAADSPVAVVRDAGGAMVGLLTQKDCFRPVLHAGYYQEWTGQVADFMSPEVVSVAADEDLMHVAEMFQAHPHRVFPVLSAGQVVGLVHRSDVLARLLREG